MLNLYGNSSNADEKGKKRVAVMREGSSNIKDIFSALYKVLTL